MTRYIVVGAGAIGAGIGGRLTRSGQEVVLVARGDHLAALRAAGLRLRTPREDVRIAVEAIAGPGEVRLRADDILVLATKTQQAAAALAEWADVPVAGGGTAGERLPLMTALNGVAGEPMALRYFSRVYGACVWMWAAHLMPGEVILEGVPIAGVFHIGRYPARTDPGDAGLLEGLRDQWRAALLRVELPADVMPWKYRKLLSNLGNAVQALCGGEDPGLGPIVAAVDAEARTVLAASGIAVTSDEEEAAARANSFTVEAVPGLPGVVGGSTWQSLARRTGNVETDYFNGEIVLLARLAGRAAPLNATLARLTREAARRGDPPGGLDSAKLARLLGLPAPEAPAAPEVVPDG